MCTVPVSCPPGSPANCNGDISNGGGGRPKVAGTAARRAPKPLFKTVKFSLKPGTNVKLRLRLTKAGRALLRKKRRVRTTAVVRHRVGDGPYATKTVRLTLKLAKKRKR